MITTIKWVKPGEALPTDKNATRVLAICEHGHVTELSYSHKHQLFNATDDCVKYALKVLYWADIPKAIKDVHNDFVEEVKDGSSD